MKKSAKVMRIFAAIAGGVYWIILYLLDFSLCQTYIFNRVCVVVVSVLFIVMVVYYRRKLKTTLKLSFRLLLVARSE